MFRINILQFWLLLHVVILSMFTPYAAHASEVHIIKIGDKLNIAIYNEGELSGSYSVQSDGFIKMPLIGAVLAQGLSIHALERHLTKLYQDGYLINPDVRIDVGAYQSIYIMGEVKSPGQYPYAPNLTALNAVALAGGYTYRAKRKTAQLKAHQRGDVYETIPLDRALKPGDTVLIEERFF